MTSQQALESLGLTGNPSLSQIDAAHRALVAEIDAQLQHANDEAIRQSCLQRRLALTDAYSTLLRLNLSEAAASNAAITATGSPPSFQSPSGLSATKLADLPGAHPYQTALGTGGNIGQIASLQPGHILANRFEIKAQVGAGGMGAVYRAHDLNTGDDIAVKVMLPGLIASDDAKQRFLNEAKIAIKLGHQHIVNTYDVQMDGAYIFITMELLEGNNLRHLMEERKVQHQKWSGQEVIDIMRPLCEALKYAHQYTVHRDIKPENVWINHDGSIKLMDFGIARLMLDSQMTQTSTVLGTVYYMAPEQLTGAKNVDHRADLYSVGVMVYELLAERVPSGRFKPLNEVRDDISGGFSDAVDQALEAKPENRYSDMTDFVQALESGGKSQKSGSSRSNVKKTKTTNNRAYMLKWVVAGLAVMVLAVVGYLFWGKNSATRYQPDASKNSHATLSVPSRPRLPFVINENVWRAIESSEAYLNLPKPHSIKTDLNFSTLLKYPGVFFGSNTADPQNTVATKEVVPLSEACYVQRDKGTSTYQGKTYPSPTTDSYQCGFISLGATQGGKTINYIKKIDKLKGSLFPMRIGNQISWSITYSFGTVAASCQVVSKQAASGLDARLSGSAWRVHCKNKSAENDDYYFEDLGVFLSSFGVINVQQKKFVLPTPGYKTVVIVDDKSSSTTTYNSFSWSARN